ncbi:hypothetical protein K2173_028330 [Erythroxylum novogranatense]|uniref:Ninja-family protein n=1 Tax=Erythroxylum novogranatense TaxID=1862640 RepID=A0AAV8U4A9_9ROSI|nr:hypothetical protein K2173_028330 [Erythroxylum novogranatense]
MPTGGGAIMPCKGDVVRNPSKIQGFDVAHLSARRVSYIYESCARGVPCLRGPHTLTSPTITVKNLILFAQQLQIRRRNKVATQEDAPSKNESHTSRCPSGPHPKDNAFAKVANGSMAYNKDVAGGGKKQMVNPVGFPDMQENNDNSNVTSSSSVSRTPVTSKTSREPEERTALLSAMTRRRIEATKKFLMKKATSGSRRRNRLRSCSSSPRGEDKLHLLGNMAPVVLNSLSSSMAPPSSPPVAEAPVTGQKKTPPVGNTEPAAANAPFSLPRRRTSSSATAVNARAGRPPRPWSSANNRLAALQSRPGKCPPWALASVSKSQAFYRAILRITRRNFYAAHRKFKGMRISCPDEKGSNVAKKGARSSKPLPKPIKEENKIALEIIGNGKLVAPLPSGNGKSVVTENTSGNRKLVVTAAISANGKSVASAVASGNGKSVVAAETSGNGKSVVAAETSGNGKSVVAAETSYNGKPVALSEMLPEEPAAKKLKLSNNGFEGSGMEMMKLMPTVVVHGPAPNGRKVSGFLYKYTQNQVCIICLCHGMYHSPMEFVNHAGLRDVENPLTYIKVHPQPDF